MNQLCRSLISVFLIAAVLSTLLVCPANAAENTAEIINLYDESKSGIGTAPNTKDAAIARNENYHSSHAIEVSAGDKITVGPILEGQSWFLKGYNASGALATGSVVPAACVKADTICNNAVILTYTVPKGVSYIRVTTSQMFYDSTLITKNRTFTKDEYFAYMDSKSINVDYLRPMNTTEPLVNLFPVSDKTFAGRIGNSTATSNKLEYVESSVYRACEFFSVQHGDVLYFAAAAQSQGYHLSLANASGIGTTNVKAPYMVLYEDLGRGYAIYAYRMRPGTAKATVVTSTGVYEDGIALATLNQPFTGETYRNMFNINLDENILDETSPLNGLTGLFMGDSISYGSGDTISYTDPYEGKAWAGRIAAMTGLIATNASVGGAKASYISGDDTAKWLFNQHTAYVGREFDIIVMQGGVNDARYTRTVGTPKPIDTPADELKATLTTYIGGLQWLFHNIKEKFPTSTLFFIANHRLDGHSKGRARDMRPYFDAAKELCEMYGIHVIDLYNNAELNDKLETKTTKYLPDTLHLNADGYDILTPYVLREIESVIAPDYRPGTEAPAVEETTVPDVDTTEESQPADLPDTAPDTAPDTDPDTDTGDSASPSVVISIGVAVVAVVILALVVIVVLRRKK